MAFGHFLLGLSQFQGHGSWLLCEVTLSVGDTTLNMIIFSVVTTLSCSTLISNSLIISVRHKSATTFPIAISFPLLSLLICFHILTNTKSIHITSKYYHS